MTLRSCRLLLIPLLLLALVPAAAAQTATVTLFVHMADAPLPAGVGFELASMDPDGPVYAAESTAETDSSGLAYVVVFDDVPVGVYRAYPARGSGYALTIGQDIVVPAGDDTIQGAIDIVPIDPQDGVFQGTALDAGTGEPLRFATLSLALFPSPFEFLGVVTADRDGWFAVPTGLGEQTLRLVLENLPGGQAALYGMATVELDVQAGVPAEAEVAFALLDFGEVTGTVTDEASGQPLAQAIVDAFATDGSYAKRTLANAEGAYTLELPEGRYLLKARDNAGVGYVPEYYDDAPFIGDATEVAVAAGAVVSGIDFALGTVPFDIAVTVAGTVVDSLGAAVEGATVDVFIGDPETVDPGDFLFTTTTGPSGAFEATSTDTSLAFAALRVRVSQPPYAPVWWDAKPSFATADVLLTRNDPITFSGLDFRLGAAAGGGGDSLSVAGLVTDADGLPIPHATVTALPTTGIGAYYTIADAAGVYRFDALPVGTYVILATEDGYVPTYAPEAEDWREAALIDLHGGDAGEVNIRMGGLNRPVGGSSRSALGAVRGAVRTTAGAPLRDALVVLRSGEGPVAFGRTDATGAFAVEAVPEGIYEVTTDRLGYAAEDHALVLTGVVVVRSDLAPEAVVADAPGVDAPAAHRLLPLYPNPTAARLTATVELAAPGALDVRVFDVVGREVLRRAVQLGSAGRHTVALDVSGLPAGVYFVRTEAGGALQTRPVTVLR